MQTERRRLQTDSPGTGQDREGRRGGRDGVIREGNSARCVAPLPSPLALPLRHIYYIFNPKVLLFIIVY
jgi:hypothetical protein